MISYVDGDLLASDCDIIVHCCNCFCTFGAGIALQIKRQYPEAFVADLRTIAGDHSKLGTFVEVQCTDNRGDAFTIVNLYAQYKHGGAGPRAVYLDYNALETGLRDLFARVAAEWEKWPKIGMPRIGCGLAGGNWTRVAEIIERTSEGRRVFIYDFVPERQK